MNKIIEDLNWRYATKKFDSSKKISHDEIEIIKESLRLTPSSYGLQPLKFLIIESPAIREKLVPASYGQMQIKDASHLIVICSLINIEDEHINEYMQNIVDTRSLDPAKLKPFRNTIKETINRLTPKEVITWTEKQAYIALGQLLHTCASMRIDATPMEGFDPKAYDEILNLSEANLKATLVCPIGYRHEEDEMQHQSKVRKPSKLLFETI